MAEIFDGLPFYIGSGTKISEDKLPEVQNAIGRRTRDVSQWRDRYFKGKQIKKAIHDDESGAVQNVNMMFAYNAYFKFLHQSLTSLRDSFRLGATNFQVDIERPTTVLKSYLDALQTQNGLIVDDAITYGCASLLLDIDLDTGEPQPGIMLNRVQSGKIIFDFEQPGSGIFTIRVTPELAYKYTFLSQYNRQVLFNKAIASAESVAEIRVFVGELVVNGKMDDYVVMIFQRRVIYAEKGRSLTTLRAISINDKNDDYSPIYTVLKASEISRDVYKLIFDYNDEVTNPIRTGAWNLDSNAWEEARRTRYLKLSPVANSQLNALLPGNLNIEGLVSIQNQIQLLSQQATGLNDYTKGESTGSVRTAVEAMMLSDSASGILNILANKIKSQLILPCLADILEILKVTLSEFTDIFDDSLYVDVDIAKDQQEANLLMSLINMPMFGAVIQGLDSVQALQLFRWILEKLHISGTASVFDTLTTNAVNQMNVQQQSNGVQQ